MLSLILTQSLIAKENFTIEQNDEKLELSYFPKRIVTDSAIISRFLAALDIELVGVPSSTTKIPEEYNGVQRIGRSGMPDLEIVKSLKIAICSKNTLDKFDNIIMPLFKKINELSLEIDRLTKLRDTLLPKLMTGEIKIN